MTTAASLRESLASVVAGNSIVPETALPSYSVEGVTPKAAVFPTSQEQLSAVLALAAGEGWAVVPRGNGSLMALGGVPKRVDVVLGLSRLPVAIEHAPGDLTVTVGAGTTLAELQDKLAKEGQWLPLDPPLSQRQTVGGVLATNLAGPLSLGFGTARDMVIGMKVAGPDGVITKSGGKVVKNVTGFDVAKVHLGALGTLGVIVEASFKVAPMPKRDVTLVASFDLLEKAMTASMELASAPVAPQALEVMAPGGGVGQGWTVYARFMGVDSSMERRLREGVSVLRGGGAAGVEVVDEQAVAQAWQRLADFGWDAPPDDGLLLRMGCLPSRVTEMATAVAELARQQGYKPDWLIGPGRGLVRCHFVGVASQQTGDVVAMVADARQLATRLGGYAVVERCPVAIKAHVDAWGDAGDGLLLMRRLKEQLDPRRILNPGRFVGGI
ncbi:MAG: FAD-binding oxidoreductase [Dehalococcoidia bacterium]|nr:FAD-binding oxidoreductase [Dehalococcoidia bacterium]